MKVFGVQISFQFLKLHTMTGLRLGTHCTKQSSGKENILMQMIFVLFNLNMAVLHWICCVLSNLSFQYCLWSWYTPIMICFADIPVGFKIIHLDYFVISIVAFFSLRFWTSVEPAQGWNGIVGSFCGWRVEEGVAWWHARGIQCYPSSILRTATSREWRHTIPVTTEDKECKETI